MKNTVLGTLLVGFALSFGPAGGMEYQSPDASIQKIIDAPLTPQVMLSPDRSQMLIVQLQSLPTIAELAEPELKLAGYRIKPATFGPSRGWSAVALSFQSIDGGTARSVSGLPENPKLGSFSWSPDGSKVAFTHTSPNGITLWMADAKQAKATQLSDRYLNMSAGLAPTWTADGESVLATFRLENEGDAPERPSAPTGPTIQENMGQARPARTYQDLLSDSHDEALYQHYFTAQLAKVNLRGRIRAIGEPAIIRSFDPAPNGELVLVETVHKPFSYTLPASRFPYRVELYTSNGKLAKTLVEKPLQDEIPLAFGSVEKGPRNYGWRADAAATLAWAEAQDGGDAGADAEIRDALFIQDMTDQNAKPLQLATLGQRSGGMFWGDDNTALALSWWWPTRNVRIWKVAPGDTSVAASLLHEYSWQDRYNDPGTPVMAVNDAGQQVLKFGEDGQSIFLIGDGASDEGDRPFLDRLDLNTGNTERLFRSEAPYYEMPVTVLDSEGKRVLTQRENIENPPNYFLRDLDGSDPKQLTSFPHPTPELVGISKEMVRYEREDGVPLNGTLYLPKDYDEKDGPLPTILWAYPTEFKSADAAGQVTDSPYRFVRVGWWSPLLWLTKGYAVLDDPTMPIIGEGDVEPNDTYVEQLVGSAKAAVDMLVEKGVGDRERMVIGGHSYGAFMTANLLAHSDLFATGIARSGAYNRTLTPFGFQAEERTFWESPEIYFNMSPFMHADKINEPMLMIHGAMDNNSGTFPMQSERMFDAMKALGGTVRLVMLPYESHGYRARESIMHVMWETQEWMKQHLGMH